MMTRSRKKWLVLVLSLLALASGPGCKRRHTRPDPGVPYAAGTASPKLAAFIFKEEGKLYMMTVGVNATRFHDKDALIPLAVLLTNKTTNPILVHLESFTLLDPVSGSRYGLASIEEVRRQGRQSYDRQLMDSEHLPMELDAYRRSPSNFFPNERLVIDQVELHQFQYMFDTLYFPRPEGQLLGKTFELHVNAKGLTDQIFVVFTVPEA